MTAPDAPRADRQGRRLRRPRADHRRLCRTSGIRLGVGLRRGAEQLPPAPRPRRPPRLHEPTPVPSPESELFIYNWDGYIGETTQKDFEDKYGIRVKYDKFPDASTQITKIRSDGAGGGYDLTYPASTDVGPLARDGVISALDQSLIPNLKNLGPTWVDPAYDPGNKNSVPELLVDDRDRLGSGEGQGGRHQLGGAVGREVQGQARDAVRPAGGLRRRRVPPGLPREHDGRRAARRDPRPAPDPEAAAPPLHRGRHRRLHQRPAVDDPGLVR